MQVTHAVGIDLGTTYSCLATLNEQGEPYTLENEQGELSTPSVVLIDGDEIVVGSEALNRAVIQPERVVQNAKRFMGDPDRVWKIDGRRFTPIDIAALVLKKLLAGAQRQIGPIEQAVITVPAPFSDAQRHATIEAGHRAGLKRVDLINEPVAAALCHVLGAEGLWFTELANEQRILVYDLGGGTFDLSLVRYRKNEVSVIASTGDLNLGGIDWNRALETMVCDRFAKEFGDDPRTSRESLQALSLAVERTKRSLSVRPRAALNCSHAGHQKTFQIELTRFEKLTRPLVDRTEQITRRMLEENRFGWAHVDVVLMMGGSSRMPMVRNLLKRLGGRTLNTSLPPDLSIAHGATYYAGMLLANDKFARSVLNPRASQRLSGIRQQSVNARALGILVRNAEDDALVPHYLIPANTPLPASATERFGTVIAGQPRVHLQIVESGTTKEDPAARLGACVIHDLPADLPEGSEIAVKISYDAEARVHVTAADVASGSQATAEIIRRENVLPQLTAADPATEDLAGIPPAGSREVSVPTPTAGVQLDRAAPDERVRRQAAGESEKAARRASRFCLQCGEVLNPRGECPECTAAPDSGRRPAERTLAGTAGSSARKTRSQSRSDTDKPQRQQKVRKRRKTASPRTAADEGVSTADGSRPPKPQKESDLQSDQRSSTESPSQTGGDPGRSDVDLGEDEFWSYVED